MLCVDQSLFISSVVPIVGVFVVVGHRWGRMIRRRWFGGGSRLASEVRESSVVFKSGSSLGALLRRYESWGLPFKAQ